MKKHILISTLLSLGITACSQTPSHIIVAPDITIPSATTTKLTNKAIHLLMHDLRANQHLVQIMQEGKAATLINDHEQLSDVIKTALTQGFKQQGAIFNPDADNSVFVNIEKALINVEQTMFNYKTNSEIELKVTIRNFGAPFDKTYRVTGSSNGPLTPDLAVLGRDFNQQLGKIMTRILTDQELHNRFK